MIVLLLQWFPKHLATILIQNIWHLWCFFSFNSWASGANPWGPEKEDNFAKPTHYDGMLEIVGVSGVVHMGQIQGGMRSGTRIAQGGHVSLLLFLYYTLRFNEVERGVYWYHLVRLSVRPSVRLWTESCPLHIFKNTHRIHFIFAHLIKQLQKVCRVWCPFQN